MKIGIIDADLLGRKNHRFPNLACEKISAYWKEHGEDVSLIQSYDDIDNYDKIFLSKVFTDTPFPEDIIHRPNVSYGGTGFFFDKAPDLPYEIEHHMPDYSLYDDWITAQVEKGKAAAELKNKPFDKEQERRILYPLKEYTDYSIGFLTRGCFRKCDFCVNKKYDHAFAHSPLDEFYDPSRKKICLLDDNFFACPAWKQLFMELVDTKKPFKFKQGLDERLLTEEKCELLFSVNYDSDYTFAFDNISDYDLIHNKLRMIRKYTHTPYIRFYVLCGFESTSNQDIKDTFKRVALLQQYKCLPYIMRFQAPDKAPWRTSENRDMYVSLARWCNQPSIFKRLSFREFCEKNQELIKTQDHMCPAMRAMTKFEKEEPEFAKQYFDLRFNQSNSYED